MSKTIIIPPELQEAVAKDAAALQGQQQHVRRANAEPLPGPLQQAFEEPPSLHGFQFRPVVPGDFILAKKLDSPLYRHLFALAEHLRAVDAGEIDRETPVKQTGYSDDEAVEMVYQFTVPLPVARAELRKGREHFNEIAHRAIGDHAPIGSLPQLVSLVQGQFFGLFNTAVSYEPTKAEGEETVFRAQPEASATASVGGGVTSRDSAAAICAGKPSSSTNSQ